MWAWMDEKEAELNIMSSPSEDLACIHEQTKETEVLKLHNCL